MNEDERFRQLFLLIYTSYREAVKWLQLKDESMLALGMITMAVGLLIGQFSSFEYSGVAVSSFFEGLLIGLSLVMNLAYLHRKHQK
jgi:hypothetical protein